MSNESIETKIKEIQESSDRLRRYCDRLNAKITSIKDGMSPEEVADQLIDLGENLHNWAVVVRMRIDQLAVR